MFRKLVFQGFREDDLPPNEWQRIADVCETVLRVAPDDVQKDADGLLVKLGARIDRALMDKMPGLKLVGMFGTGYGRIDGEYARTKDIAVFNVAGYATESVAEFVFGALLGHIRDLPRALTQAAAGNHSEATFTATELRGKTIGIVGLGAIGRRVAKIAANGFGMNVLYWSRRGKDGETGHIRYAEIGDVLTRSNYVSLHLALNRETEAFMSAARIDALRTGAVLVNTAPMELLDIAAVEARVARGDFTLILDHADEMAAEDILRLKKHANCLIYPPIAYLSAEATARKQTVFVDNIVAAAQDGKIPNQVN